MSTRAAISDALATSQARVMAYFQEMSQQDLERPATASGVSGAAPWRAKDHLAHLTHTERAIQHLLRRTLAGDTRDVLLRLQYPEGMPLPGTLGDWNSLTLEEQEQLELAVASVNQTYVNAHQNDTLEQLVADYVAARLELLDLLQKFSDEHLAAPVPTVVGERAAGDLFAGGEAHATQHIAWIEDGWSQRG